MTRPVGRSSCRRCGSGSAMAPVERCSTTSVGKTIRDRGHRARQVQARFRRRDGQRRDRRRQHRHLSRSGRRNHTIRTARASNALLIGPGPRRTATRCSSPAPRSDTLPAGPLQVDLHGGGIDARGATSPDRVPTCSSAAGRTSPGAARPHRTSSTSTSKCCAAATQSTCSTAAAVNDPIQRRHAPGPAAGRSVSSTRRSTGR